MRTTISIDDRLGRRVQQRAAQLGLSVSAFIARTLDDALKRSPATPERPFRLVTVKGDGVVPGIDLDRHGALLAAEDQSRYGPGEGRR